jgi:hypothetical protein
MQYLRIRQGSRTRADGTPYAVPFVINKTRKYGSVINQECISRTKPVLVVGAHDSGKTRWLRRLHESASAIWGAKSSTPPLWISAFRPLLAWVDDEHVAAWWNEKAKAKPDAGKPRWSKMRQWERAELLPTYLSETGAVLFLDDCHKLSGRKLQIARECAMAARIWIATASEENRIPPNLRAVMLRRDPQIIRLDSEVAYDATALLMWIMIAVSFGMGAWELAAILGGLKLLGKGRRAARQD